MKTRNLLLAFALPTLFAACTAEEIVNQADNNVLEGRALLGDLSVKIENPVASRASWSEEDLSWGDFTEEDVFSGAVVDATRGTVGDNLFTNYIYKNVNGSWETTSQMVEGIYSFYSYNGITTKNDRKPVAFDLTAQTADLDNPTKVIDDNQLFFSPLYNIEAKNTTADNTIALPLTFYPYHSIAAFKMTNATGQSLLISQIIANGQFAAKGAILPSNIKKKDQLYYTVRKGENVYKVQPKTKNDDGSAKTEYTAAEILKAWQEGDFDNIEKTDESLTLAMNCGNWEWEDGAEIMAYMVMPAGSDIKNVEINVVDEEGEAKLIRVEETKKGSKEDGYSIASTGITKQSFKRSVPVSMFGYTSAGAPKGITAKAENLMDAKGYYIDTKEALIDLVNISRGDILVYNFGELAIDAEVAEIIAKYTGGMVTFTNPIDVKDTEEVTISNINFEAGVTVKGADSTTGFEGTTVILENVNVVNEDEDVALTIEAGATVTIKGGIYEAINNAGTLSVEATVPTTYDNDGKDNTAEVATIGNITTTGALTLKGYDHKVTLNGGSLEYQAADLSNPADEVVDNMTVAQPELAAAIANNISLTIGEKVTMNVTEAIANGAVYALNDAKTAVSKQLSIVNNGKINASARMVVSNLTNSGEIESTANISIEWATVTNSGLIETTGTISNVENSTLNNNNVVKGTVHNTSLIVCGADSEISVSDDYTGRINNTEGSNLEYSGTKQTVFYVLDEDFNVEDLSKIRFDLFKVNTLSVQAKFTWDLGELNNESSAWGSLPQITAIEFENGSSLFVPAGSATTPNQAELHVDKVKITGTVIMNGWDAETSIANFGKATAVTMAKGAKLIVKKLKLTGAAVTVDAADLTATEANATNREANASKLFIESNVVKKIALEVSGMVTDYANVTTANNIYVKDESAVSGN